MMGNGASTVFLRILLFFWTIHSISSVDDDLDLVASTVESSIDFSSFVTMPPGAVITNSLDLIISLGVEEIEMPAAPFEVESEGGALQYKEHIVIYYKCLSLLSLIIMYSLIYLQICVHITTAFGSKEKIKLETCVTSEKTHINLSHLSTGVFVFSLIVKQMDPAANYVDNNTLEVMRYHQLIPTYMFAHPHYAFTVLLHPC